MKIEQCGPDRFEDLLGFVVRLNAQACHHIGYFGVQPADIRQTLLELAPERCTAFRLAYADGGLVGALGLDFDLELGRAWLHGPLVEHPEPDALADRLYADLLPDIPAQVSEQELFCDLENSLVHRFAARHGFAPCGDSAVLGITRAALAGLAPAHAPDVEPALADAVAALHDRLFPRSYASGGAMLAQRDEHHRVLTASEGGLLQGYIFAKVEPLAGLGYTDFIGVDPAWRGRGVGRRLLSAALHWMFSFPEVRESNLTVNVDNSAARALYRSLGYEQERVLRGYRTPR